jgi:RNA polymerase sigma-70 factor (ECF subfamily)
VLPAQDYSAQDEQRLTAGLAAGDRQAFTALYTRHLDALYQYILLFTGNPQEAEEIVQDVFVRIWERRALLGEIGSFKAYVFRAAKNQLINFLKREQVRLRVAGNLQAAAPDDNVNASGTREQVDYRGTRALLGQAIRELPKRRKEIFLLSTEEGLSLDEIAVRLGISKNVVKKQLYEGYAAVREYLTRNGELSAYLILLLTLLQA